MVSQAVIHDRPEFKYRGLMIDTSRNFIPVKHLRRMVDAMSMNKLNILHWHITDTNSFPFFSKSVPQVNRQLISQVGFNLIIVKAIIQW